MGDGPVPGGQQVLYSEADDAVGAVELLDAGLLQGFFQVNGEAAVLEHFRRVDDWLLLVALGCFRGDGPIGGVGGDYKGRGGAFPAVVFPGAVLVADDVPVQVRAIGQHGGGNPELAFVDEPGGRVVTVSSVRLFDSGEIYLLTRRVEGLFQFVIQPMALRRVG